MKAPTIELAGLGYRDLQNNYPDVAEEFDNYNLLVMSVAAQREEPINELFVRLNRSKSLTGAEIRNAMSGPAPEVIRKLAKHELFETNVRFVIQRGQDLNPAAKILMFEYEEDFETGRTDNRKVVQEDPKSSNVDRELIEYDNFNRSTNDLQSHEGRFKILKHRFEEFVG